MYNALRDDDKKWILRDEDGNIVVPYIITGFYGATQIRWDAGLAKTSSRWSTTEEENRETVPTGAGMLYAFAQFKSNPDVIGTAKDAAPSDYRKICLMYKCRKCMGGM
ncbi:unnamed protein product [Nippostrongylus brasiliensis]|uniref:Lipoprotein n=1 Tax=Nippostrongylus brasiliensis TaxID=27835 RepID=A0A0N4YNJ7_NIPBR|nr:unnamed protein product [Nippostrongylus brasiliensis]